MKSNEDLQARIDKANKKRDRLFKTKGYEHKGYCYYGDFYEHIGDRYSDLRDYVIDNFGWGEWFNTVERNSILSECGVIVQFDNENGAIINYNTWVQKKKELSYKDFNKWVVTYINVENINRRNSLYD